MKDVWKIICFSPKSQRNLEFGEILIHQEPENKPWTNNKQSVYLDVIFRDNCIQWLHKLSNFELLYSVSDIENHYDKKIEGLEYELELAKKFKKKDIQRAIDLWIDSKKFDSLKKWTRYKDYFDDGIDIEEIENLPF